MTERASCPAAGEVHTYFMDAGKLARDHASVARGLSWLDPAERARFDRFRHDDDRFMFLGGRVLARTLVGRALSVGPTSWAWREGPHGRPEIAAPATPLTFNLAHSAGLVVCALSTGREVGVDVEDRERSQTDPAVVTRYCSPAEIADIESRGPAGWRDRFLAYWTLKEAYLKARGLGIAVPLAEISFTLDGDTARISFLDSLAGTETAWRFHLVYPTRRHVVAIAGSGRTPFPQILREMGTGLLE